MLGLKQTLVKLIPKRIWYQVGLVFALILSISLLFLGFMLIKTSKEAVRNSVLRDYQEITSTATRQISDFIDQPKSLLINTAGILGTTTVKDIETQKFMVYQLITDHPTLFERLSITNIKGREILSSDLSTSEKDYSLSKVMQEVLSSQKPSISKVYFSAEHFPYITIAVPIKRLNQLDRVLIAEVKLNSIWKIASEIKLEHSEVFLVDEEGYVLVHNEEKKVCRGENLKESAAIKSVLQGKTGSIEEDLSEGKSHKQWLSAYAPINPLGWGLVIRQPLQTAYAFSFRMQKTAVAIIAVAILMAILSSLSIARWIVHPIKELTEVTEKVAAGNLDQEIKSERNDEIGRLIRSFNEMARRLKNTKQLEKLSNIGVATSKIAHELRNPLVALKTFIQLLPKRHQSDKFISEFNEIVPQELARLEKMLGTLTNFSAEQRLQLKEYDIISLMRSSLELFKEQITQQKVNISTVFEPDNINLSIDSDRIKQVFINLIRNAIESMPDGGNLTINSKICLDGYNPKYNPLSEKQKVVEIKISDTGYGMDGHTLNNAFEPFYTSKRGGLGLGLTISKEIIEQHQGIIQVESQKDKGTTFTIKLPVRS
ncbi:MAG: sensor histidine kinase [Planctomycetota bacterium]